MAKNRVDMKKFLDEVEGNINEGSEETLAWISEETDPIVEWRLIQTAEDSSGKALSFIVFTTASGDVATLPLLNENVSELIHSMITSTPNLNPESVPYVPDGKNFWKKYKKQLWLFGVFLALFALATIANIIVGVTA